MRLSPSDQDKLLLRRASGADLPTVETALAATWRRWSAALSGTRAA